MIKKICIIMSMMIVMSVFAQEFDVEIYSVRHVSKRLEDPTFTPD